MKLTGPQRAAVIVSQLDDARARELLKSFTETEVIRLMTEVARLPSLTVEDVRNVVQDFTIEAGAQVQVHQGGVTVAQKWLEDRLGPARAAEVLAELAQAESDVPLSFLNHADANLVAGFISDEHPQTIALVLSHIHPEIAARVLDRLGEDLSANIVQRMATIGTIPGPLLRRIADDLEARLAVVLRSGGTAKDVDGVSAAAAVLNNVDRGTEKMILEQIEANNPELAEVIRAEMFVFEDVAALDDATLQVVLRNLVLRDVAHALKTVAPDVRDKFIRNMSERAAADLQEEIQALGPTRKSAIEAAQAAIVKCVRELADAGKITVGRGNDDLIV